MLTVIGVVIGLTAIAMAVSADRATRGHHTLRAVGLNLIGLGCVVLGMVSVFLVWTAGRQLPDRPVAWAEIPAAKATAENRALVVRLAMDEEGQLRPAVEEESLAEPTDDDPAGMRLAEAPDDLLVEEEGRETDTTTELGPRSSAKIDFDARPAWVDQPAQDVGELHQIAVDSGPFSRLSDARRELKLQLKFATDAYINEVVGQANAARWIGYSPDEIPRRFVQKKNLFNEKIISSVGQMHQSHALLEFGPAFHNEVEEAWHEVLARAQLAKLALVGGAVLGMLVLLFGYFSADSATRGFYSRRLKFVTALAILALVATGIYIARSIPWLWL